MLSRHENKRSLLPLSTLGIGSVPYRAGENICEIIFKDWDIPFWPQFPSRSLKENCVFQFLSILPGLAVSDDSASFDEVAFLHSRKVYERKLDDAFLSGDFRDFGPPDDWALGYSQLKTLLEQDAFPGKRVVKLQVTGPETVWRFFFKDRVSENNRNDIKATLSRTLTAAGLAQIQQIRSVGRVPLVFVDEPINSEDSPKLEGMVNALKRSGALVGLHACSNLNWKGVERLSTEVFHFDASIHPKFDPFQRSFLQKVLKSKRYIAWGIVPTTPSPNFEIRDFSMIFLERLKEISDRTLPVEAILENSLISPACGTGTLSLDQDRAISESVRLTAQSLKVSAWCVLPSSLYPNIPEQPQ